METSRPARTADWTLQGHAAGNRLLAAFPGDVMMALRPDLKLVTLEPGVVCFERGDPIEQVYWPLSGLISLTVAAAKGEMVETLSIGLEGAAGLQAGLGPRLSPIRGIVQIGGQFFVIPASRLEQAVSHSPALRDLIVRYTERLLSEALQNAACNAIHDSPSRLCRLLLECSDHIGTEQLTLTQEQIADMLGVRRTTVTLLAQELQTRGVVRYSRGRITLVDRAGLESCACECYRAKRHDHSKAGT